MSMRPTPVTEAVAAAHDATVDPETQARHLEQIRQSLAASDTRMTYWADRHVAAERRIEDLERAQGIAEDRIADLEDKVEALAKSIRELRFQAVTWNEALTPQSHRAPRVMRSCVGDPVLLGPAEQVYLVPSATRPDLVHQTAHMASGNWTCSCEATAECWHIRACRELGKDAS